MDDTQKRICDIAETWLGTPFVYGACRKGCGVDCAKFILGVFKEAGLLEQGVYPPHQHKDWNAGKNVNPDTFMNEILKYGNKIPFDERQPGDVISFIYRNVESHLAILVEDDCIIHAHDGREVIKKRLRSFSNVCSVYRIKNGE